MILNYKRMILVRQVVVTLTWDRRDIYATPEMASAVQGFKLRVGIVFSLAYMGGCASRDAR